MYLVVHETIIDNGYLGVRTWTDYGTKEGFVEACKSENMKNWYKTIAEGVSGSKEAIRICDETRIVNHSAFLLGMFKNIV